MRKQKRKAFRNQTIQGKHNRAKQTADHAKLVKQNTNHLSFRNSQNTKKIGIIAQNSRGLISKMEDQDGSCKRHQTCSNRATEARTVSKCCAFSSKSEVFESSSARKLPNSDCSAEKSEAVDFASE